MREREKKKEREERDRGNEEGTERVGKRIYRGGTGTESQMRKIIVLNRIE